MRLATPQTPSRWALHTLAMMYIPSKALADNLSQEYCSNQNTGADYQGVFNTYQSNGACYTQCKDNYAFAIVQYQYCWCSDYIPADQQSTSNCNQKCPGYPSDQCGNESEGMYGYIPLPNPPSGTMGVSSSAQYTSTPSPRSYSHPPTSYYTSYQQSSSSSSPPTTYSAPATSTVSQTVYRTVTQQRSETVTPSVLVSYVTPTSSSSTSSAMSTSTSSSTTAIVPVAATTQVSSTASSASMTPSPVTSVQVVTVSGAAVTQTVTSTPLVPAGGISDTDPFQRNGLSGGAIAGIVIGSLLGLAAVVLAAFLLWRRSQRHNKVEDDGAAAAAPKPKRTTSVLSRTGLLSRGRPQSMMENSYDDPGNNWGAGANSTRHSLLFGASAAGDPVSPVSPLGSSQGETGSSRRHSRPMVYDQRLNPSALFANPEANGSRVSMQDQQDYSRPLGVANPDLRSSFDSRISRP